VQLGIDARRPGQYTIAWTVPKIGPWGSGYFCWIARPGKRWICSKAITAFPSINPTLCAGVFGFTPIISSLSPEERALPLPAEQGLWLSGQGQAPLLHWSDPGQAPKSLHLVNVAGQTLWRGRPASNSSPLALNFLAVPKGIYLLQIDQENGNTALRRLILN
jgi:hypothetical protein